MGAEVEIGLPGLVAGIDFEKFRVKARAFLRENEDHGVDPEAAHEPAALAVRPRSSSSGCCSRAAWATRAPSSAPRPSQRASGCSCGCWSASTEPPPRRRSASSSPTGRLTANQIEFVNLIVDHLTEHGVMKAEQLYESPFTDIAPHGPDALFAGADVDLLIATLRQVRATAVASIQ